MQNICLKYPKNKAPQKAKKTHIAFQNLQAAVFVAQKKSATHLLQILNLVLIVSRPVVKAAHSGQTALPIGGARPRQTSARCFAAGLWPSAVRRRIVGLAPDKQCRKRQRGKDYSQELFHKQQTTRPSFRPFCLLQQGQDTIRKRRLLLCVPTSRFRR